MGYGSRRGRNTSLQPLAGEVSGPIALKREDLRDLPKLKRPAREDVLWQLELATAEALARCGATQSAEPAAQRYMSDPRGHVRRRAGDVGALSERD